MFVQYWPWLSIVSNHHKPRYGIITHRFTDDLRPGRPPPNAMRFMGREWTWVAGARVGAISKLVVIACGFCGEISMTTSLVMLLSHFQSWHQLIIHNKREIARQSRFVMLNHACDLNSGKRLLRIMNNGWYTLWKSNLEVGNIPSKDGSPIHRNWCL